MRIDGVLRETLRMPPHVAPVVVSRIKVMARLDIAERRVPQDGRIGLTLGGKLIDVRVSTLPSRAGERVVLRILDKDNAGIDLDRLGMTDRGRRGCSATRWPSRTASSSSPGRPDRARRPRSMPACKLLNDGSRNILTVEDPVEYAVDGVGQTQVNPQGRPDLRRPACARSCARIRTSVMVGEIRDRETADIAVQASLTGHLVLSTVHTNDAVGAITRMRDMKVEPFLIASTLRAVIAQRLVRRLCPDCREPVAGGGLAGRAARRRRRARRSTSRAAARPAAAAATRAGSALFEAVRVDDAIRRLINAGGDEVGDRRPRLPRTRRPWPRAARALVRDGVTSPEEAVRVVAARGGRCLISPISGSTRPGASGAGRCAPTAPTRPGAARARAGSMSSGSSRRPRRAAPPLLSRGLFARKRARRQAAHLVHPPARDPGPGRAARGGAAHDRRARPSASRSARILGDVHAGVVEGRRLADAMAREPKSFPPLYRAMVAAGEGSGTLAARSSSGSPICSSGRRRCAARCSRRSAYPIVLAVVAAFVVFALMIFVVPKVVEQFDDVGQQLPFLTRMVIGLSDFLADWWWALLIGLAGAGLPRRRARCARRGCGSSSTPSCCACR